MTHATFSSRLLSTVVAAAVTTAIWPSAVRGQVVWFVNAGAGGNGGGTTWGDAFADLQDALDVADAGDQIWVAAGTYLPSSETEPGNIRTSTYQLANGVAIYGGFAGYEGSLDQRDWINNESILDGDLWQDDGPDFAARIENAHHVVSAFDVGASAVLDGFIVTAGDAPLIMGGPHKFGGGMLIENASPTVRNCTFRENSAFLGAGVAARDNGQPLFFNCVFDRNRTTLAGDGGGMYDLLYGGAVLAYCTFIENQAGDLGGGLCALSTDGTLAFNCAFYGNVAGRTDVIDDIAGAGGAWAKDGSTFVNCVFASNWTFGYTGDGGGLMAYDGVRLANCTFASNWADGAGGGILCEAADVRITNCVLWGNLAQGGAEAGETAQVVDWLDSGSSIAIDYSCVQGWTGALGGVGNHGSDPLFVAEPDGGDSGDLHLRHSSPCIDAGDSTAVPADALDLDEDGDLSEPTPADHDGGPRFVDDPNTPDTGVPDEQGVVVDMGAYEFPHEVQGYACSDGDPCTTGDIWIGGLCSGQRDPSCPQCQTDAECDDHVPCTDDACVAGRCQSVPDDTACSDDGIWCNGDEVCHPSEGCTSSGAPCRGLACDEATQTCGKCLSDGDCDDGIGCTDDLCVNGRCVALPNDSLCPDDGVFCNGADICDATLGCVWGGLPCSEVFICNEQARRCDVCISDDECDDGIDCTIDACRQGRCDSTPDDQACPDDGEFCNGAELCLGGVGCVSSGNPCSDGRICDEEGAACVACLSDADCDDGIDCTDDVCLGGRCSSVAIDAYCPDDGHFCNGQESCQAGTGCVSSGNPCPAELACDEAAKHCVDCTDDSQCEDGERCTVDVCLEGTCTFEPIPGCGVPNTAGLDYDQDGVPNGRDQCPDTPLGLPVNDEGCPQPPSAVAGDVAYRDIEYVVPGSDGASSGGACGALGLINLLAVLVGLGVMRSGRPRPATAKPYEVEQVKQ